MSIFLFLFFSRYNLIYCSIVLNIKILPEDNYIYTQNNHDYLFFKSQLYKSLYTLLEIGNPTQIMPIFILPYDYFFEIPSINPSNISNSSSYIDNNSIYNFTSLLKSYSLFNETKSNSYLSKKCEEEKSVFSEYDESCLSNDSFIFYNENTSLKKTLSFLLIKRKKISMIGKIGILLYNYPCTYRKCFLEELKKTNLINNYVWYFKFNNWNDNEGKLYIGTEPHEDFPDIYSKDDLEYTKINDKQDLAVEIIFDKIYIEENNNNITTFNILKVDLLFDSDLIIAPKIFLTKINSLFLNEYIDKGLCFSSNFTQNYINSYELIYFYCYENITNILYYSIPNIKFFSFNLNYIFELTNDELFTIKDGYVYIKILFTVQQIYKWYLGRQFTMKYQFAFYPDNKVIGFYRKFKESTGDNFSSKIWKYLIFVLVALIFGVLSVFIGIKIQKINSNKKKRANELLDDYDYSTENINSNIMESDKDEKNNKEGNKLSESIN